LNAILNGFQEVKTMSHELCTAYDVSQGKNGIANVINPGPRLAKFVNGVDMALDWITESLDRKFVSAMERCVHEPPDKKREMKLLKRTVLVLVCIGLAITVVSIKFSVEAQMAYAILG
jgi:hypothetical protein